MKADLGELVRRYIVARDEHDRLARQRFALTCERENTSYSYVGDFVDEERAPCWKLRTELKYVGYEGDTVGGDLTPIETWCATCRERHRVNAELRTAARRRGAALRAIVLAGRHAFDLPAFTFLTPPEAPAPKRPRPARSVPWEEEPW